MSVSEHTKGVGFIDLLQILFIGLKLAEVGTVATWSWFWVLSPAILILVLLVLALILWGIGKL